MVKWDYMALLYLKKIILSTTFFEEFEYLDNLSTYLLIEQGGKFPKSTTQQFFNCNKANK